jgi:hypothetical protein
VGPGVLRLLGTVEIDERAAIALRRLKDGASAFVCCLTWRAKLGKSLRCKRKER